MVGSSIPEQQTVEILELGGDGRYVRALGATLAAPGCDNLAMDLDELWRETEKPD